MISGLVKRLCHRAILMLKGEVLLRGLAIRSGEPLRSAGSRSAGHAAEKSELTGNYRHGDRASTITGIRILAAPAMRRTRSRQATHLHRE